MRGLTTAELLDIWERGLCQEPAARALSLLAAAYPEMSPRHLAALSIGQRDARLVALREALFGSDVEALVPCPQCGERLELNFSTADLLATPELEPETEVTLSVAGYHLRLRTPNSQDLLEAGNQSDLAQSRRQILRRCLLSVNRGDAPAELANLSAEIGEAVAQKLAEIDPLANIQMNISCSVCKHAWQAVFDIVSFFWTELEAWAGRMLQEVHALASAYGWSEQEILALSPMRRQVYLGMLGA